MSYCLNPACSEPHNPNGTRFCLVCGSKLILRERYRALKLIGQGGFGRTFLAVDEDKPSKPYCVIKQFFPQAQGTTNVQKASELFEQEAVRLDDLGKHPQIPELLAHFTHEGRQYLVQEYINGQNLEQVLEIQGAFSENQVQGLLKSLLPVLEFIHAHQVIHRDVKPENIIRREDGRLVLVDFGAAKFATATALMRTGTSIGTPEYIAPEQARGRAVFASDLYGLGVSCIHLLTGVSPFELFDVGEDRWVWREYLGQNRVGDRLCRLLDKLIENAVNRRYASAVDVLKDLNTLHSGATTLLASPLPKPPTSTTPVILKPTPAPPVAQTWRCVQTLRGHLQWVRTVAVSPGGKLIASGGEDNQVKVWDLGTGENFYTLRGHTGYVTAVTFMPNGQVLLTASEDKSIKLWDVRTGKLLRTLADWSLGEYFGHSEGINAIALSHDGQLLLSASNDRTLKIWRFGKDIAAPGYAQVIQTLTGHTSAIRSVALHPNLQTLASGSADGTIKLWQVSSGREIGMLGGFPSVLNIIYAVAFSPDGVFLATGGWEKAIKIWHWQTGEVIQTLEGHSDYIRALAFSPDQQTLASCSDDYLIKIWDFRTGKELANLAGHTNLVNAVAFSADNQTLVSGGGDNTVKIWQRGE